MDTNFFAVFAMPPLAVVAAVATANWISCTGQPASKVPVTAYCVRREIDNSTTARGNSKHESAGGGVLFHFVLWGEIWGLSAQVEHLLLRRIKREVSNKNVIAQVRASTRVRREVASTILTAFFNRAGRLRELLKTTGWQSAKCAAGLLRVLTL